jgi:hypothetical protein
MKAYTADFAPALVARDQLEFAKAELSTYQNQRVTGIFNDALAAVITGQKTPSDSAEGSPGPSRRDPGGIPLNPMRPGGAAMSPAPRLSFPVRDTMMNRREWIYGWLLLLPALVFLFAFTHIPAVTTFLNSFFSTTARTPAGKIHRSRQLRAHAERRGVLEGAGEQSLVRAHHSGLRRPGDCHGAVGQREARGRSFVRMAYFTPTVLPLIAVANIWLFFYTPGFGLDRPDHRSPVRLAGFELSRRPGHRAQRDHRL